MKTDRRVNLDREVSPAALTHLWVARAYRRRGIATELVRAAGPVSDRGGFTDEGRAFLTAARRSGLLHGEGASGGEA